MINKQCDGQSQSPIDITKSVSLNQSLTKILLDSSWNTKNLEVSTNFTLKNKGYTVELSIDDNVQITSKQNGKTSHE